MDTLLYQAWGAESAPYRFYICQFLPSTLAMLKLSDFLFLSFSQSKIKLLKTLNSFQGVNVIDVREISVKLSNNS